MQIRTIEKIKSQQHSTLHTSKIKRNAKQLTYISYTTLVSKTTLFKRLPPVQRDQNTILAFYIKKAYLNKQNLNVCRRFDKLSHPLFLWMVLLKQKYNELTKKGKTKDQKNDQGLSKRRHTCH